MSENQVSPTASLQGSLPANVQINPELGAKIPAGATIDDLIPAELKNALQAKEPVAVAPNKRTQQVDPPVENDDEPDDEGDAGNEVASDGDDDLDLSSAAIDKMLTDGDPDAVVKKKGEAVKQEAPSWAEVPEYQALVKKARGAGIKADELDGLLRTVADRSKVESSTYLTELTKERDGLKNTVSSRDSEIQRLQALEREIHFDTSAEVQEKYTKPMNAAETAIRQILNTEGVSIPTSQILAAKNKVEFQALISDVPFEAADLTKITNYWRQHRELQDQYARDRSESRTRLAKQMSLEIPKEKVDSTLKDSLLEMLNEPSFSYIKDAIADDLSKYPEVNGMLGNAKKDFHNLTLALSNPVDHVHSGEFLRNLAKYVVDNADAKLHRAKFGVESRAHAETKNLLKKTVQAYRELKASAGGITGKPGAARAPYQNGRLAEDSKKKTAEDYEKLLSGKLDIDKILEGV